MSTEVKVIGVDEIRENPVALRNVNLEGEGYIGLCDSIRAVGILSPISVRRKTEEIDGTVVEFYELLDGLHRYTAARACGLKEIPVNIKSLSDAAALEAQTMANLHVVATKPVEFTRQLQRIFAANPTLTLSDMATKVCKSASWISQRLNLLRLEETIQKFVDDGQIKVSNAVALSKLPPEEQSNYVQQACTMASDEFVPLVQARAKEIKDASRQGKSSEPQEYVALPRCQKMIVLKEELTTSKIGPALTKQHKAKNAAAGFALGVAWVLCVDPTSIKVRTQENADKKRQLDDAKKVRAAERAKQKAEEATKSAAEAQEALTV